MKEVIFMKYFSMFSGIGGFEIPMQELGWKCVGFSEIDKYAIQIYSKHFPKHKNYGDATTIDPLELPDFDLLCGGFPCQAFSIAGKRQGFNDTRGTLFFDIARIIKVKRPGYLLLENVKGLLSHDEGRTFRTIITTLDELGYDLQWQVLNSKNFGVPQNRERVFIIGHLRGKSRRKIFPIREADAATDKGSEQRDTESEIAQTIRTRYGNGSGSHIIKIPEATKQGYAIAEEGDSINLAVPESKTRRGRVGKGIAQTLDTGMQQYTIQRQPLKFLQRNQKNIEGDYAFTVDSMNTGGIKVNSKIRRLTPLECERLQAYPDRWTEGLSDNQRYKCLGNGVTVNVIRELVRRISRGTF